MLFDKAIVLEAVKLDMEPKDKRKTAEHELAMGLALDDLSMRLRSQSFITSYTTSVSSDSREVTVRGDNDDLRFIFAITMGTGTDYRVMEFENAQQFLRDHNSPEASAGKPDRFTILESSEGYPTVRFNKPLASTETMKVYYYLDVTPDNISASRSVACVTAGTKAYFYGISSEKGAINYAQFQNLAALSRASDTFTPRGTKEIHLSREDKMIRSTVKSLQRGRR